MSDTRWDLKASSTVGPDVDTGLGAASAVSRVFKNTLGLVRARTAQSFSPVCWRLGSTGKAPSSWGGTCVPIG